jgi:hypothetical protein
MIMIDHTVLSGAFWLSVCGFPDQAASRTHRELRLVKMGAAVFAGD